MRNIVFVLAAAVLVAAPAHASYDQAMSQCKAFAEANKISTDPCVCIAKAIGDNPKLLQL